MSCSTILRVWPGRMVKFGPELQNGWGTAPLVWDAMSSWYLGGRPWITFTGRGGPNELWRLHERLDIPAHRRAVHLFTYDCACVSSDDYARFADDIDRFVSDADVPSDRVNHWPAVAAFVRSERSSPAIGLWATSVGDNPFDCNRSGRHGKRDWSRAFDVYSSVAAKEATDAR